MNNLNEEQKKRIYELIDNINKNTDFLCLKQFYNYYFNKR